MEKEINYISAVRKADKVINKVNTYKDTATLTDEELHELYYEREKMEEHEKVKDAIITLDKFITDMTREGYDTTACNHALDPILSLWVAKGIRRYINSNK